MFKDIKPMEKEPSFYWKLYEKGIDYLNKKRLIERTRRNWNFYLGRQWEGIRISGSEDELPFFNFIRPNVQRLATIIHQNRMTVRITDSEGRTENDAVFQKLTNVFDQYWELSRQDIKFREMIKNAAIAGDGIQYFGTSNVEDVQILDNTSLLYGDESEPDIQRQPYIIIWQRESVKSVKKQALENGVPEEELDYIRPDNETEYVIGNRDEVDEELHNGNSKVTTLIHMHKKDGCVWVAKSTKNVVYEKEHKITTTNPDGSEGKAMTLYPLIKFSWEIEPNNARGISPCEMLIPNQIEVNKTLARLSMTTKLTAYPKLAYIEGMVNNPDGLKQVGEPIALDNTSDASSVNQIISYLQPASPTQLPQQLMTDLLDTTQELAGSGDIAMGNVNDLQRVAASAVNAVNEKSESMHDEIVARKEMVTEDLCWLFIEHMQLYETDGMTVVTQVADENPESPKFGQTIDVPKTLRPEEFENLKPKVRIDVTKANAYTEELKQSIIDNMFNQGQISLKEYGELASDMSAVPKAGIEKICEQRDIEQQQQMAQQQMMGIPPEQMPPENQM